MFRCGSITRLGEDMATAPEHFSLFNLNLPITGSCFLFCVTGRTNRDRWLPHYTILGKRERSGQAAANEITPFSCKYKDYLFQLVSLGSDFSTAVHQAELFAPVSIMQEPFLNHLSPHRVPVGPSSTSWEFTTPLSLLISSSENGFIRIW
jgi:hypothetical protein